MLEIGPGGGVLTVGLLEEGAAAVDACELDRDWAFHLRERLASPRLRLLVADALGLAWRRFPEGLLVAGNLPYNVATAVIERLLLEAHTVPRAGFLVQREVAERLVAGPGEADYGALSVLTVARAEARILGRVGRGAFRPRPEVDGAFVGFALRPPPLPAAELCDFAATVRLAFGLRRKTLRNALAAGWGRAAADRALDRLGLGPKTRAEALPLEAFVALHRLAPDG